MNIFRQLNSILSAYNISTAKDLIRLQRGKQPKNTVDPTGGRSRNTNLEFIDRVRDPSDEHYGSSPSDVEKGLEVVIRELYSRLRQLQPEIEILDQFKDTDLRREIRELQERSDKLKEKLRAYFIKVKTRRQEVESDYYRETYGIMIEDEDTARIIAAHRVAEEYGSLHNTGQIPPGFKFNNWFQNRLEEIVEQDRAEINRRLEADKKMIALKNRKYAFDQISREIDILREKIDGLKRAKIIQVELHPKFDLKDVSHVYDEWFAEETGKKNAQRMSPEQLRGFDAEVFFPDRFVAPGIDFSIIISRSPYDIGGMTEGREWEDAEGRRLTQETSLSGDIPEFIQKCALIAYFCLDTDTTDIVDSKGRHHRNSKVNIQRPFARLLIKPYTYTGKEWEAPMNYENPNWILRCSRQNDYSRHVVEIPPDLIDAVQDYLDNTWNSKVLKKLRSEQTGQLRFKIATGDARRHRWYDEDQTEFIAPAKEQD